MNNFYLLLKKFPVLRGMATYSVLWPSSDTCQQLAVSSVRQDVRASIDYYRLMRFSLFGALWVAPTVYIWVKTAGRLFPGSSLANAIIKAVVEQLTYSPFSIITFYYGMSLIEGKSYSEASKEVNSKLIPTWKAAATVWPLIQTFNFAVVPEHNRVVFVGVASFIWTAYLSFMKSKSQMNM